jgi:ribonuclease G
LINQAAAQEICNQIVLRNISGIIVIDFLDMMKDENKHKILCILSKFFNDKYEKIIGFNELGLVFIKRKRVKNSVDDILLDEELLKDNKFQMLKPIYLMSEIYKKIVYHCNYDNIDNFILYVSNHLNKFFTENDSSMLKELELVCHKKIELKVVNSFSNNKYEVIAG